jgi:deoxyribonucleoside regulator
MARTDATQRRDFLVEVARLYYEQRRSQAEIARTFAVSRSLISNLLKVCREKGIVEIRINDPRSRAVRLQALLCERFGLSHAMVVSSRADAGEARAEVGRAAAGFLEPLLEDGLRIGISWGTTLHQLVTHVRPRPLSGAEVVQLHGGLGAGDPDIDGFGLAQRLAAILSCSYRTIPAPILVRTAELRDLLMQEPRIRETLALGAQSSIALFGIGSNQPAISSLVRSGILTEQESRALADQGAVGTVCGLHIDAEGRPAAVAFNQRLVGLTAEQITRIPMRVGLAAGAAKAAAVLAALRGRFITALVVDQEIAERVAVEPDGT